MKESGSTRSGCTQDVKGEVVLVGSCLCAVWALGLVGDVSADLVCSAEDALLAEGLQG